MATQAKCDALWQDVVKLTEAFDECAVRALRVAIYVRSKAGKESNVYVNVRRRYKLWLTFLRKRNPLAETRSTRRRPLFGFFYSTSSNMQNLLPVAREMTRNGESFDVLLGEGVSVPRDELPSDVRYMSQNEIEGLVPFRERMRSMREAAALTNALVKRAKNLPLLNEALGTSTGWMQDSLTPAIILKNGIKRLFANWEPNCIVSTSDLWPYEHIAFSVARERGLPGTCIQHGVIDPFWWPSPSSQILLWGQPFFEAMLQLGASADRLGICGMPASDSLFQKFRTPDTDAAAVSRRLKCVILSSTHGRKQFRTMFSKYHEFLRETVPNLENVDWSVKLHPGNENESFYRQLGDDVFSKLRILPKNTSLQQAVQGADVACTLNSTSGLEAMIMQRPTIVLGLNQEIQDYMWWPALGGGKYIANRDEMKNFVNDMLANTRYRQQQICSQNNFLERAFANQGQAAKAVADVLRGCGRIDREHIQNFVN